MTNLQPIQPNWGIVWLGVGVLVFGLILYGAKAWWANRQRQGEAVGGAAVESVIIIVIKAIADLVKQGKIDFALILLGILLIVGGAFGPAILTTPENETPTIEASPTS